MRLGPVSDDLPFPNGTVSWFRLTLLGVRAVFRPVGEPRPINGKLDRIAADVAEIKSIVSG